MYSDRKSQQSEFDGRRRGGPGYVGDGFAFWIPFCFVVVTMLNITVIARTFTEERIEDRIQEYLEDCIDRPDLSDRDRRAPLP